MPPLVDQDGLPLEENIRIAEDTIRQRIEQAKRKKEDPQSQKFITNTLKIALAQVLILQI